jgi:hypothetical protein
MSTEDDEIVEISDVLELENEITSDRDFILKSICRYSCENQKRVFAKDEESALTKQEENVNEDELKKKTSDATKQSPHLKQDKQNSYRKTEITRTMKCKISSFLHPEIWKRHDYSFADIVQTIEYFREIHLWHFVLLFSQDTIASQAAMPSMMDEESKIIRNLSNAISTSTKIAKEIFDTFPNHQSKIQSVLTFPSDLHKPRLPVHRISGLYFEQIFNVYLVSRESISVAVSRFVRK